MAKALADRKAETLERLMAINEARRGQLSGQYYTRKAADGQTVRQGPYYVWQRYVKGKKRSVRVRRDQVARVEAELEKGREVDSLLDELWTILEEFAEMGEEQSPHVKKKPRRPAQRASARRKQPSS